MMKNSSQRTLNHPIQKRGANKTLGKRSALQLFASFSCVAPISLFIEKSQKALRLAQDPLWQKDNAFSLLCQGYNLIWTQRPVVDTNVVNQSGKVGSGSHGIAGPDIKAVYRAFQVRLSGSAQCNAIRIERSV